MTHGGLGAMSETRAEYQARSDRPAQYQLSTDSCDDLLTARRALQSFMFHELRFANADIIEAAYPEIVAAIQRLNEMIAEIEAEIEDD